MTATFGQTVGLIAGLGGAALAMLATDRRLRTASMGMALLAAAALVWEQPRLETVRDHPPLAAALALAGLAGLVVLGAGFRRWPAAFPILATLALPLRVPIGIGGETSSLLIPLYVVIAGGVVAAVPDALARRPGPERSRAGRWLRMALAGVLALYAAQALYSIDVQNAVETAAFFYIPFAVLFVALDDVVLSRRLLGRLLIAIAGLMAVLALIGIGEFITRGLILNADLRAENTLHIYFRVNSLFRDPNIFGRYLALGIVCAAGWLAWQRDLARALGASLLAAVMLVALAFSFSLTSFAALLAGLLVIAWARLGPKLTLAAVAAAILAAVVYAAAFGASGNEVSSGGAGRTSLVHGGLDLARDRPAWGYGSGSFGEAFYTHIERARTTASHDTPIEVAAEQGAVGLLAYAGLLLAAGIALFGDGGMRSPLRVTIAALFVTMLVHTLGYASFLEDPATWVILAFGLLAARTAPRLAPG